MSKKKIPQVPVTQSAWAIYLRTSSKEAQNPENSQKRQIDNIYRALVSPSQMVVYQEYRDIESGTRPDRYAYQQMLADARQGKFSHIAAENAERFGRDDTEALRAIDELSALGVAVRFSDYPNLDPMNEDNRLIIVISFTLARRESIKISQRTKGGIHTMMRSGGHIGKAPDGYINLQEKPHGEEMLHVGKMHCWIEPDPERWDIIRLAWTLLIEKHYSYDQICTELFQAGHTYRGGRPFLKVMADGRRVYHRSGLSNLFHNYFYAGWVVSDAVGIPPKTVRGRWQAMVTDEEFEEAQAILNVRNQRRTPNHKRVYLLSGVLYLRVGETLHRMTGSTPNTRRHTGGNPYYHLNSQKVHFPCNQIDQQIPALLANVRIADIHAGALRKAYKQDVSQLPSRFQGGIQAVERKLADLQLQEERILSLYAEGKITREIWDMKWQQWQVMRKELEGRRASLAQSQMEILDNLDSAFKLMRSLPELYGKLQSEEQRKLLQAVIDKVVVNHNGDITEVYLHPPFGYLHDLGNKVKKTNVVGKKETGESAKRRSTCLVDTSSSDALGILICSSLVFESC